jgi:hypothetical protein
MFHTHTYISQNDLFSPAISQNENTLQCLHVNKQFVRLLKLNPLIQAQLIRQLASSYHA